MNKPKKTINDLRALHDKSVVIPNRIKGALAALKASGDVWAYEADLMALAKPPISTTDFARYREGFADYWVEVPAAQGRNATRRVWFATAAAKKSWEDSVSG